jgi:hypothetical protein
MRFFIARRELIIRTTAVACGGSKAFGLEELGVGVSQVRKSDPGAPNLFGRSDLRHLPEYFSEKVPQGLKPASFGGDCGSQG